MEAKARAKYVKGSPQKARLVVDLIRGKTVDEALAILRTVRKRAAGPVAKALKSAVANAEQKSPAANVDDFVVSRAYVDLGPTKQRRRIRPAPMGRAHRERRWSSHITIHVSDGQQQEE
ncbi:MAG: 50S ribosomal protein L22 [Acidobacteria bacterium]|nr:50S ribosomal protein L22 [Acidobacteriota bacterium]